MRLNLENLQRDLDFLILPFPLEDSLSGLAIDIMIYYPSQDCFHTWSNLTIVSTSCCLGHLALL